MQKNEGGRCKPGGGLGWSKRSFDAVDWVAFDATLNTKGHMYQLWLSKQSSGCYATQVMVSYWDKTRDGKCPDCGKRETANHLNLCSDPDRTRLLHDMVASLQTWLNNNYRHRELAYWIPKYILLRGTKKLSDFPYLSPAMKKVARSQDLIPWKCFLEGKLSVEIAKLQRQSLASSPSRLTIADWTKRLISQLLQIAHAQWVFRNVSLHDARTGYIRVKRRETVLAEIDRLAEVDPILLPENSKYLLEIDFSALHRDPLDKQSYWVLAMKAAVKAGQRTVARSHNATARQRRAYLAVDASPRRVNGGPLGRMLGDSTLSSSPLQSRARRELARRQRGTVAGAAETLRQIEIDFGAQPQDTRRRSSSAAGFLERRDTRRRMPD